MPIFVRASGTYRIGSPRFKRNGVWQTPAKVFRRVSGVYQEIWPMLPNPVTVLNGSSAYSSGSDRVDLDFTWSAPVGGFAVVSYLVAVSITADNPSASSTLAYSVTSPGLTLTNYQDRAGGTVTWTVTPNSANGAGATTVGNTFTIARIAPPSVPVITSVPVLNGVPTVNWSYSGGANTLSYFRVTANGLSNQVGKTARAWPLDNYTPGTNLSITVTAVGPGGSQTSATTSIQTPRLPSVTISMLAGKLHLVWAADGSSPTTTLDVHALRDGAWQSQGSVNINVGVFDSTPSASWTRGTTYGTTVNYIYIQPQNSSGSGALTYVGFVRKINNPYRVAPIAGISYLDEVIMPNDFLVRQGVEIGGSGRHRGYWFYGDQFRDLLSPSALGYSLPYTSMDIGVYRFNDSAENYSTPQVPYLWIHRSGYIVEADSTSWSGYVVGPALSHDQSALVTLPTSWIGSLLFSGFKGFGVYSPNDPFQLNARPDLDHAKFLGATGEQVTDADNNVWPWGTVEIYHNG